MFFKFSLCYFQASKVQNVPIMHHGGILMGIAIILKRKKKGTLLGQKNDVPTTRIHILSGFQMKKKRYTN